MKGRILHFRGRKHKTMNQLLISLGLNKAEASRLIGRKVVWKSTKGKEIFGKVTATHGSKGVLRARFSKGLPGSVLGKDIEILE